MTKIQFQNSAANSYDPRWFVWTIIFLLVTGVGLTSYIIVTTSDTSESHVITSHRHSNNVSQSENSVRK